MAANAASTSPRVSAGAAAAGASAIAARTAAGPSPIRPWRGWPERNAAAAAISSGASRRSSSASAPIFSVRERVAATRREVVTRSKNSIA